MVYSGFIEKEIVMKKLPKTGSVGVTYYIDGVGYKFINGSWWAV